MDSCNFWKLDKIDKFFISLVCIVLALYSTFQCFASESESVQLIALENLRPSSTTVGTNATLLENSSTTLGYFYVEPGYQYTITAVTGNSILGLTNDLPSLGSSLFIQNVLSQGDTYTFSSSSISYYYVLNSLNYTVSREKMSGLESSVDILCSSVGPGALWSIFEFSLPYVLVVVTLVLGFYFLRRTLKWVSRGRGRI